MKNVFASLFLAVCFASQLYAQAPIILKQSGGGKYHYQTVADDPLNARVYHLENGLTVYLSVNKNEPRVQCVTAVRAGSKHDPADATGLAHYLEHMLFKGNNLFGTTDFAKEKPLLDTIEVLYERYRRTTDPSERKKMYAVIDSVSGVAATYAVANEYDKLVGGLGAKGTNASTWNDYTRYINDIPSNEIQKWLILESGRYRDPQMRLFHTELEAVYEEKNRSLDNDAESLFDMIHAELFKHHTYGTQTTIGTTEHLKNPSITRIMEYFHKNYVPNNMCIALSGDFDPDSVIVWIDNAFKWMEPKGISQPVFPPEAPITSPVRREVVGPDPETLVLAYRFSGVNTRDADMMQMVDMLLSNSTAGLFDLNLNQEQKVLQAGTWAFPQLDYSVHYLMGDPLEGQKLEEVEKLLLSEVEKLKQGKFDESMMKAVVNDLTLRRMRESEKNYFRANNMADSYINFTPWSTYTSFIDRLSKFTKKDVMKFVADNYKNNYVVVYKRQGKRDAPKVDKPAITPIVVNREAESAFAKTLTSMPSGQIAPRFLDYENDIKHSKVCGGNVPLQYLQNNENELFTLYYKFDFGKRHDKKLAFALDYFDLLGTDKLSAADVKKKFYSLGLSVGVTSGEDESVVYLSGLNKNFGEGVKFFEEVLLNVKADEEALQALIDRTLKARDDAKKQKGIVLQQAMSNFAKYGKRNPFTNILSEKELRALTAKELTQKIKGLTSYPHTVVFYGATPQSQVESIITKAHKIPTKFASVPTAPEYTFSDTKENKVYFVNFDMVQAEAVFLSREYPYDPSKIAVQTLFNDYYGQTVYQDIRESKALAYSTWASFQRATKAGDPNWMFAYIGTQADKLPEAMQAMTNIISDMPRSEGFFAQSKEGVRKTLASERITRTDILTNYANAKKLGLNYDIRKDVYNAIPTMSYSDIDAFHKNYVKNQKYTVLLLANKDKVDLGKLTSYGPVEELKLEDVFGY